jgi:membrane protein implicated in regulation of membrane protease activity
MDGRTPTGSRAWYLLLLIPIVALLWVPLYAKATPELFGFPVFYWYQFAWVPGSVVITWLVYTRTRTIGPEPPDEGVDEATPDTPTPGGRRPAAPAGGAR